MTFLSEQSFDVDGKIKTIKKKRKIMKMDTVEEQEDGSIKGKAEVKFEYGELTRDDLTPVGNLLAAEVYVLEEGNVFWGASTPPLNHIDESSRLAHRIGNAAANIANFSKRGMGNTVIFHPSVIDRIEEAKVAQKEVKVPVDPTDPDTEMKTEYKPYFQEGQVEFIEHDAAPEDKVLVIYRGPGDDDQPLIYVEGEGLVMNNTVADVETYGKFVRIP